MTHTVSPQRTTRAPRPRRGLQHVSRAMIAMLLGAAALPLVAAEPSFAAPANVRPRPRPDAVAFPHGYTGVEHRGLPAGPGTRRDPLGILRGPRRFAPLPARPAAADEHQVTADVLDRNGKAPATADDGYVGFTSLDGQTSYYGELENGHLTAPLPAGTYVVQTGVYTPEPGKVTSITVVYLSHLVVDQDRSVVLDARRGRPLALKVDDRADARVVTGEGGGYYARILQTIGGELTTTASIEVSRSPAYVTPADPAPGLKLLLQARLTKDGAVTGSPYVYNVAGAVTDEEVIPADPTLHVRTADLATVRDRYATQGRPACAGGHTTALFPGSGFDVGFYVGIGSLPAARTEYFSTGVDWDVDTLLTSPGCDPDSPDGGAAVGSEEHFTHPGTYLRDRTSGPIGAGPGYSSLVSDGGFQFWEPMFSSWSSRSGIAPFSGTTGQTTLRDAAGDVIGTSDQPGYGDFHLPPGKGTYQITTDAARQVPWSDLATSQHDVWTFTTRPPAGDDAWISPPLPAVVYRTALDGHGNAPGAAQDLAIAVRPAQSSPAPTIRRLTLQVSYDDGAGWQPVTVRAAGGGWTATLHDPEEGTARYVSLRAVAEDSKGDTVEQTVIHAYGLGH